MPHKTKTGWKWANVKRKTKGELAKTVYGIWKKNGSKGSFSDFWHGKDDGENTNESEVLSTGETTLSVNGLKIINTSRIGSEHMNTKTVKSRNATQTIDEGYSDSTEEINTHEEQLPEPPEEVETQHTPETETVTPESVTTNTTTLVESWGTPWQRIGSNI